MGEVAMANMYISFLLEFYQPPTQAYPILNNIIKECYVPIGKLFNCDLNPKFTISMTHSLMDLLDRYGRIDDVVPLLRRAVDDNKIEIAHSGAYHPIFPLIPRQEVVRQIELDVGLKEKNFGRIPKKGIIPPELCYDDKLIGIFKDMGFKWTLVDDKVMATNGVAVPDTEIYQVDGFTVFMRSSLWSDGLTKKRASGRYWTGKEFVRHLRDEMAGKDRDCYKILELTGETFGHHIKYYQETYLRDMLFALRDCDSVRLCTVSELLDASSLRKVEKRRERDKSFQFFPPSSVATTSEELRRGDLYPHWKSNDNLVHEKLWALTNLILEACRDMDFGNGRNSDLREMLDRAFYSGQYFSASVWYWDPKRIYEGIDLQMRALYKYARLTDDKRTLEEGQHIYAELMWQIFKRDQR
jgi:hypothetical protein